MIIVSQATTLQSMFIKWGGSTAELRKKDKFNPAWPKPIVLNVNNKRQREGA